MSSAALLPSMSSSYAKLQQHWQNLSQLHETRVSHFIEIKSPLMLNYVHFFALHEPGEDENIYCRMINIYFISFISSF